MAEGIRIDKWLWAIRIFKTRTLASAKCKDGQVRINDSKAKASSLVRENDVISVVKEGFNLSLVAKKLIKKRVGAPLAIECFTDLTPPEEYEKFKDWYIGKKKSEYREKGAGRPTKKDRRHIEDFKENFPY